MTVAREIFEDFEEHSASSFFSRNKEVLGYTGRVRNLTTLIHEGVTNAIDAAEEARVLPSIYVAIKKSGEEPNLYTVVVEDNASGIPEEHIPKVFGQMLAGTKMHRNVQNRGQQGIGISGGLLFVQATTGRPVGVTTSTSKDSEILGCQVTIDIEENRGETESKTWMEGDWVGTRIEFKVKDVVYRRSRYGPLNYLRMSAMANPHVEITFEDPKGSLILFERGTDEIPKRPEPIPPHPQGVDVDSLLRMARSSGRTKVRTFLTKELSRFSRKKLERLRQLVDVDFEKRPSVLTWSEAEKIVFAFKKMSFISPPSQGLHPIKEGNIRKGLNQVLDPNFSAASTRSPEVYRGGIPFIVEVGLAYGGNAGSSSGSNSGLEILRFGNRSPLIFNQGGCALTKAVKSVNWRRYGVDVDRDPVTVLVNIVSTHVPYTSTGKQSVAKRGVIFKEVRQGAMQVGRGLKRHLRGERKEQERKRRMELFEKYLPIVSQKAANVLGRENPPDVSPLIEQIAGGNEDN